MKKVKTEISPLPCGVVSVNKKPLGRVLVGIVDGNRLPAFGFDVKDFVPNHFRMVPFGSFGVFAASRQPIEVRVILDGQVVRETQLFPKDPPEGMFLDPMIRKLMTETPTPHYLAGTEEGLPFLLNGYNSELHPETIIAEQLHAGRYDPPPTIDMVDNGPLVLEELREDVDPRQFFANLQPAQEPEQPEQIEPVTFEETPDATGTVLSDEEKDHPEWQKGDDIKDDANTYRQLAELAAVAKFQSMAGELQSDESSEEQSVDEETSLTFNPGKRASSWAPSNGLVAIGVRFIQVPRENEPLATPDGFTYVLFQLNPWELHLMAHCRLLGRKVIPSRDQMNRIKEAEGFGGEVIHLPDVSCGQSHPHR